VEKVGIGSNTPSSVPGVLLEGIDVVSGCRWDKRE
jgi:hypothetical protein